MDVDIVIRQADVSDIEGIALVHVRAWQEAYQGILPKTYLSNMSIQNRVKVWQEDKERMLSNDPKRITFVACQGKEIVGFAGCGEAREDFGFSGELYAIYLREAVYGNGLGLRLFQKCVTFLEACGFNNMYAWVLRDNKRAIDFYQKTGASLVREHEKDLNIEGTPLKEVMYGWYELKAKIIGEENPQCQPK